MHGKAVTRGLWTGGVFALTACLLAGCADNRASIEPRLGPLSGLQASEADTRAETVRRDPKAYLLRVAENCRQLQQYTLTFTRQERRGLFNQLYGPERIACWFRREPFSVRMKWLDEDVKYGESTYVAGQAENKVRFVPRRGWLGLEPSVTAVDLQTPVIWGEAKYPLTTFGLERLMERSLKTMKEAGEDVVVTYHGLMTMADDGRSVHHLRLEYPPARYRVPTQELYIDVATDLPAATVLKYASGRIDAAYLYQDLNTNVALSDEDFLLELEREQRDSTAAHAAYESPPPPEGSTSQ